MTASLILMKFIRRHLASFLISCALTEECFFIVVIGSDYDLGQCGAVLENTWMSKSAHMSHSLHFLCLKTDSHAWRFVRG